MPSRSADVFEVLLQTPRLYVRRLSTADLEDFQHYRTNPELARYQGWSVTDDAAALEFLREHQDIELFQPGSWHQLGIADAHKRLIGDIGVHLDANGAKLEIGVTLSHDHQGSGLATEALGALIPWLWETTAADVVEGITDARNAPSARLLERLGMTHERSEETTYEGELITELTYRLERPAG